MPSPANPPLPHPPRIVAVFHDAGRAGAELVLLSHLIALRARGAHIAAVLPRRGPLGRQLATVAHRLYYHTAPWWIRLQGSRTHPSAWDAAARGGLSRRLQTSAAHLRRLLAAEQPDCVLTAASVLLSPALAARQLNIPSLQFVHEWPGAQPAADTDPAAGESRWDSPLAWADALAVLRDLNTLLIWSSPACALAWQDPDLPFRSTPAEMAQAWHQRQSATAARETFLPHPIDLSPYAAPATVAASPTAAPLKLACIATWSWRKGLDLIPAMLDGLNAAGCRFECTLVGRQPADLFTRRLQKRLAAAPWSAQVRHTPYEDNLPALFARTNLLIHPAREDTSPLILAHALAAGVPIVAADLPGIRELLTGYNPATPPVGTLLPPGDSAAWTAWLTAAANSWAADHARRQTQLARGRTLAHNTFAAEPVYSRFQALLAAARATTTAPANPAFDPAAFDARLVATHRHTAGAALWAWRDEAVDWSRGLLSRFNS